MLIYVVEPHSTIYIYYMCVTILIQIIPVNHRWWVPAWPAWSARARSTTAAVAGWRSSKPPTASEAVCGATGCRCQDRGSPHEWCQKLWLSPVVGYLYMNGVYIYMWPFLYMKPYGCDGYYCTSYYRQNQNNNRVS